MSDMAGTNDARKPFVREAPLAALPPPVRTDGVLAWLQRNLFSSPLNIGLTLVCVALLVWAVPPFVRFMLIDAVWDGASRADCLVTDARPAVGACWAFVIERINFFTYGFYPTPDRWRVDLFFLLLAVGIGWLAWLDAPARRWALVNFFVVLPIVSFILLVGWPAIGLPVVPTEQWGGILVTIVVSVVGIVFSLPLGVLLALGRRSTMPAVRLVCVVFIEFIRGVPLITILFMASLMLPLFVPDTWSPDKLLRALIGIALFASAYMAEVVRAGLQAIPRGQYEAAQALGLSYTRTMGLIVLPQALRITIPNIVNSYIALFKDTTLVFVVGIFDFLNTIEAARLDPKWSTPVTGSTGYAFAALFYFTLCMAMSRYALYMERRLDVSANR